MAAGKRPNVNGVILEFYSTVWYLIGLNFKNMIHQAILAGRLPSGTNTGLVVLLPRENDLEFIEHWRPTTLLNLSYKLFAKVL